MARIIKSSGRGPLYTGDSFATVIDRDVKRVPGKSGVEKLGEALKLAETLAKSEVVGAVGGLIGKGVSKIGEAIEEAGMVSEAEKEKAAFEAEKAQALKIKEAELETPTAEADVVQKEMTRKIDRNRFITELKDKVKNVNRDTRTEVLKFVGEGTKRGLLTPEESQQLTLKIDEKVMTPVGKDVADRLTREINDLEAEASEVRKELDKYISKGVMGFRRDELDTRYRYLKEQADKKRREKEAAVGGVEVETPTEGSPVKEIIKQIRSSGKTDQALLALREKARKGEITFQQKLVLEALEGELAREEIAGGEVIETVDRETKVAKAIPKKSTLAKIRDKTPEEMRAEAEASSLEIGSEEDIPMEPTPAEPSLDEKERLRKKAVQDEIDEIENSYLFKATNNVRFDDEGRPFIEKEKSLSPEEILAKAKAAKTLKEQAEVLKMLENADVMPKTLLDMATGAHRLRFAEQVKGMFSKIPLSKEMSEDELALLRARTAKTQAEADVVKPKAAADIEAKKAGAALSRTRTNEVQQKVDALWKGINLPVSQIIKNLRKPTGSGAGAAAAKRLALASAAKLAENERKRINEETNRDIEVDKSNISKADNELNKLGPDEAMPSKPKIGSPDNVAKYEKEVARVKQANAKREQLRKDKKSYVDAMNEKLAKKVEKIKTIDDAEAEVIKRVNGVTLPVTKKSKETPKTPAKKEEPPIDLD